MVVIEPSTHAALELDLSDLAIDDIAGLEIGQDIPVVVYIPLDSIGVTNSHVDICDDLAEAIWVGERLAAQAAAARVAYDYPPGTHKTRLRLTLEKPAPQCGRRKFFWIAPTARRA